MSIVGVTEVFDGRSASTNNKYERFYKRNFTVETSSPFVGPLAVRTLSGIPQIGARYTNGLSDTDPLYESDWGAFVNDISVDEVSAGIEWKVTLQYGPWDPATFGPDPMLWPLRATFSGERTERVCDFDKTGAPIRNSATDKFGDPVTVDDHIKTIVVTRNELVRTFDPQLASDLSDTTNNAAWNGIPAGYGKMGIISTSEEQYDSNGQQWYYKVTYPIQVDRKPWAKVLLDQGFNQLDSSSPPRPVPITNNGQPISDPVTLDGSGHRLATNGTPVSLTFDVFDQADWSALNINMSLRLGL